MVDQWTAEWSNAVFSIEERDARWRKVRALMARDGIDVVVCLPCTNSHDRGQASSRYLTQLGENSDETTVVFPIEGEVVAWHSRGGIWPSSNWFKELRAAPRGTGGRTVAQYLREIGFNERGTIGIAGLTSSLLAHVRETEGEVNWQSVDIIMKEFPNARVVSATGIIGEARYQKSEAEIEFLRKGTEISEKTIRAVRDHARAGVAERHVFAWMNFVNADAGGSFQPMFGWISGPLGATYHRVEQPSFRTFQTGDVLSLEVEGRWGGYIGQLDQTFSIGPAHQDLRDGMKLTWESYDRVFAAMKPGVTVGELLEAGKVTGMNGRGTASLTMHGRGLGDDGPLVTGRHTPELLAVEIKDGCSMVIKPSAAVDGRPDYGHWGEVVVVRKNGAERLGTRPQELYELV
jgi:Xaa-Pro aminopeptidase